MKAQVASESLIILGFITILLVPLLFYFFIFSAEKLSSIVEQQTLSLLNQICDNAAQVWYSGPGTKKTAILYFPVGLKSLYIGSSFNSPAELFMDFNNPNFRKIVAEVEFYGIKKTFVDYCACPISDETYSRSMVGSPISYKDPRELFLASGLAKVSFIYYNESLSSPPGLKPVNPTSISYILIRKEGR